MEILYLKTKQDYKRFLDFKISLYKGDKNYVDTSSFVLEDLLFKKTPFTKQLLITPLLITDNAKTLAECVFIHSKKLPYLQIALFEAIEDAQKAVDFLLEEAKACAKTLGVNQIVIGLNAHISYGVGILTNGFDFKNSFDSLYNKSYYKNYFKNLPTQSLSTYRREKILAETNFFTNALPANHRIEYGNIKNFKQTCERMRKLCEQTIGKTFLYYPTEEGHFYYLMKDLKPFLKDNNFIFAVDKTGKDVGFLFWHPDFNQMLKGGQKTSALKILWGYLFNRKHINTFKINAVGSNNPRATLLLLQEVSNLTAHDYDYAETNFVWDNNLPSSAVNKRFFGDPHRKYAVYFLNVT